MSALSPGETQLRAPVAKSCPFCGTYPTAQAWRDSGPMKQLVGCANLQCAVMPSVTGPTRTVALHLWNRREAT